MLDLVRNGRTLIRTTIGMRCDRCGTHHITEKHEFWTKCRCTLALTAVHRAQAHRHSKLKQARI
jgi:hypothetical protein